VLDGKGGGMKRATTSTCKNRACRNKFTPVRPMQVACCIGCAIALPKDKARKDMEAKAKVDRKELKARKESVKKHSEWEADLQVVVNKHVRVRDAGKPCISCGTMRTVRWEAGHYIAVGANNTLRFDLDNIHLQCHRCNYNQGGNHVQYRIGLEAKIGLERLELLEGWHPTNRLSVERIKQMMVEVRAMTKALQATKFEEAA
jgi:hypothetical protein